VEWDVKPYTLTHSQFDGTKFAHFFLRLTTAVHYNSSVGEIHRFLLRIQFVSDKHNQHTVC